MGYYCGIDIGASATKLVILDGNGQIAAKTVERSGIDYAQTARRSLDRALQLSVLTEPQIDGIFSTGYGRDNVPFAHGKMTEIACHGKGAFHVFRRAMTVIDIGAQDCKVIHLDDRGCRTSFKMNRKCAAGTGAFLEEIAYRLDLSPSQLNGLAERSTNEVSLGSFCTVFAATEILERIRAGVKIEDIIKGAFRSVVKRLLEMDTIDGALVLTGGVAAHNPILATLVGESFGRPVLVPPEAQFAGALGAALFAVEAMTDQKIV